MNELQIYNQELQLNKHDELSDEVFELGKSLVEYGSVIPFDLSKERVISYASDVNRLYPWVDPGLMMKIVDRMKMGKILIDTRLGFPNIAKAIEEYGARIVWIFHSDSKKYLKATYRKWCASYKNNPELEIIMDEEWSKFYYIPNSLAKSLSKMELDALERSYPERECTIPNYSHCKPVKID